jgi:hypothetical protein
MGCCPFYVVDMVVVNTILLLYPQNAFLGPCHHLVLVHFPVHLAVGEVMQGFKME